MTEPCHCQGPGPCDCHEPAQVAAMSGGVGTRGPVPRTREAMRGWSGTARPLTGLHPERFFVSTAPLVGRNTHQVFPYEDGSVRAASAEPVEGGLLLDFEAPHCGFLMPAGRP